MYLCFTKLQFIGDCSSFCQSNKNEIPPFWYYREKPDKLSKTE